MENIMKQRKKRLDPVTFEILRHKLWAINDEQAMTLKRTSCSNVANDIKDMNCALLTAEGDVFALGTYIAMHSLTMEFITKDILREYQDNPGIKQGDMFICNDPYVGACHENDVAVMKPIFWEGRLIMWAGACLHVLDVGGPNIGSIQIGAKDIYGEQPLMPPVKIVENGVLRKDIEREYLRRSRLPEMTALDLRAKLAANIAGEKRILELIEARGLETVMAAVEQLIDTTETLFREKLRELPDGMWAHRGYLDTNEEIYRVILKMTKMGDRLIFDFTESGEQAPAIINTTYPGMVGRLLTAVLALLCYDTGWCPAGLTRAIEIRSKPGTVVHAEWPAGCCKATTGASWEVENVVSICIGKMLASSDKYRKYFQSGWMGAQAVDHISGRGKGGRRYQDSILDSMFGGTGARSDQDGIDTGGFLCSISLGIANVETYESLVPILYLYRRQLADSGGAGRFRGGATVSTAYCMNQFGTNDHKAITSTGMSHPASSGVYGGHPSSTVMFAAKRNSGIRGQLEQGVLPQSMEEVEGGELERFGEMTLTNISREDVYFFNSTGGGGYGDPLERDAHMVLADFRNALVTRKWARETYGVEIDSDGRGIDAERTNQLRFEVRKKRIGRPPADPKPRPGSFRGRLNEYLNLLEMEGGTFIQCRCGFLICKSDENYKAHVVRADMPVEAAGPHVRPSPMAPKKKFAWREFYCPECGLLLTTEVALEEDPLLWEINPGI